MKFKCLKCGNIETRNTSFLKKNEYDNINIICEKCGGLSEEYIDDETQEINELVNQDLEEENLDKECIKAMKIAIDWTSNDEVWQDIEYLKDPKERALNRRYFLQAGGKVPEKEIVI